MKFREATADEMNAAFDAVFPRLKQYIIAKAPGFFQNQLLQGLETYEARKAILDTIDAALDAAEVVRERNEAKAEKPA